MGFDRPHAIDIGSVGYATPLAAQSVPMSAPLAGVSHLHCGIPQTWATSPTMTLGPRFREIEVLPWGDLGRFCYPGVATIEWPAMSHYRDPHFYCFTLFYFHEFSQILHEFSAKNMHAFFCNIYELF